MLTKEDDKVLKDIENVAYDVSKAEVLIRNSLEHLLYRLKGITQFVMDGYMFTYHKPEYENAYWYMRKLGKWKGIVLFEIKRYNGDVALPEKGYDIMNLIQFKNSAIKLLKNIAEEKRQELDRNANLIEAFTQE